MLTGNWQVNGRNCFKNQCLLFHLMEQGLVGRFQIWLHKSNFLNALRSFNFGHCGAKTLVGWQKPVKLQICLERLVHLVKMKEINNFSAGPTISIKISHPQRQFPIQRPHLIRKVDLNPPPSSVCRS